MEVEVKMTEPTVETMPAHVTTQPAPKPSYRNLSELLRDIPPNECALIVEGWETAVLKGTLRALPLSGEHFGKVIQLPTGEKKRCTLQDEIVLVDDACRTWLNEQRRESRYRVLGQVGKVETTLDRLKSKEDSFDRLLEIRKKRIKAEQGKGEQGKGEGAP